MDNIVTPPNLSMQGVNAFFSTIETSSIEPVELLRHKFNVNADIFMPTQKHTDRVHLLGPDMSPVTADAVITAEKNILIGVKAADCVPMLIFDNVKKVIGAVHAGWRGTSGGIIIRTVDALKKSFGSTPEDLLIAVGPSIKGCSYEVNGEVKSSVTKATGRGGYFRRAGDKYFIDLPEANKLQAVSAGIPERNIWTSEDCTFCNPEIYHSYRRSGEGAGRQGGFIVMW